VSIRGIILRVKDTKMYEAKVEFMFKNTQLSKLQYLEQIRCGLWSRNFSSNFLFVCIRQKQSLLY